jgi:hypothetical protein
MIVSDPLPEGQCPTSAASVPHYYAPQAKAKLRRCWMLTIWSEGIEERELAQVPWIVEAQWQNEVTGHGRPHVQMCVKVDKILTFNEIKTVMGPCHIKSVNVRDWEKVCGYCKKYATRRTGTTSHHYRRAAPIRLHPTGDREDRTRGGSLPTGVLSE